MYLAMPSFELRTWIRVSGSDDAHIVAADVIGNKAEEYVISVAFSTRIEHASNRQASEQAAS